VQAPEKRDLISTEPTNIPAHDGRTRNGCLMHCVIRIKAENFVLLLPKVVHLPSCFILFQNEKEAHESRKNRGYCVSNKN